MRYRVHLRLAVVAQRIAFVTIFLVTPHLVSAVLSAPAPSTSQTNESKAIGLLRTYGSAQATYMARHGRCATLARLNKLGYVPPELVNGAVLDGYRFTEGRVVPRKEQFELKAEPVSESDGDRAFNLIGDYVVRLKRGLIATERDQGVVLGFSEPESQQS